MSGMEYHDHVALRTEKLRRHGDTWTPRREAAAAAAARVTIARIAAQQVGQSGLASGYIAPTAKNGEIR